MDFVNYYSLSSTALTVASEIDVNILVVSQSFWRLLGTLPKLRHGAPSLTELDLKWKWSDREYQFDVVAGERVSVGVIS